MRAPRFAGFVLGLSLAAPAAACITFAHALKYGHPERELIEKRRGAIARILEES